mgnify:CR=1 FL=1
MKELRGDDVLRTTTKGRFNIHQGYTEVGAKKLVCKLCKGDKFEVGIDNHFTAVRCPTCKYELCVHDG